MKNSVSWLRMSRLRLASESCTQYGPFMCCISEPIISCIVGCMLPPSWAIGARVWFRLLKREKPAQNLPVEPAITLS